MEITLEAGAEPILGYRLVERLGRGGCGEVWKATGPGGFELALKFVCLAESIGPLELRALQIIKDVRHPHLLATFGAWQVGRYLVIAMELAERTLLDRFRETAGQGFPGIPAPEIHEHFLDAARGLDYLNEPRHPSEGAEPVGIQHRDVKPQNLLLVGGSVKVADFGLARILEHTQTSHTGSMTPAYAAPEFFKKQTSSQSDQYSLAVTYCHLRGGRLPFTGGMAEIMAGHLLEPPDLTMLPEGEREAAARALAKEPRDRWGSCRAFVEALSSGVPAQDRVAPTTGPTTPAWGTFRPGEAGRRRRPPQVRGFGLSWPTRARVPAGPLGCSTRGSLPSLADRHERSRPEGPRPVADGPVLVLSPRPGSVGPGRARPGWTSTRDPWPDPGRSTLRHKARGPGHQRPARAPSSFQGGGRRAGAPKRPKRAPTLSLDVPASEPGSATSRSTASQVGGRAGGGAPGPASTGPALAPRGPDRRSGHPQRTSPRRRCPCRSAVTGTPAAEASAPAKAGVDKFHWDEVRADRAGLVPDGFDRLGIRLWLSQRGGEISEESRNTRSGSLGRSTWAHEVTQGQYEAVMDRIRVSSRVWIPARGGRLLARCGQVLQQAERDGGTKAVLRDHREDRPGAGLEGVGIPPADGGPVGIRVRRRSRGPLPSTPGSTKVRDSPGGEEACKPVRPSSTCSATSGSGAGTLMTRITKQSPPDDPPGPSQALETGYPGRWPVLPRREVPLGGPLQARAGVPRQLPGLSLGRSPGMSRVSHPRRWSGVVAEPTPDRAGGRWQSRCGEQASCVFDVWSGIARDPAAGKPDFGPCDPEPA